MNLPDLIYQALGQYLDLPDAEVRGVVQDHRQVTPGALFVARQGERFDAHKYAKQAADNGAVAVVGQKRGLKYLPWQRVRYVHVEDDRVALAKLAATFYRHPSQTLTTLGVTGTDGKTTTAFLLHHLLQGGLQTGLLSTAGNKLRDDPIDLEGHFTTPEAPEVQRLLAAFRDGGCTHAVIESSSHGFALHRLDEVDYDVGVWTNLSPEHLDFHKTLGAYLNAKLTLLRRARVSVVNRDDTSFAAAVAAANEVVSYGEHPESDWRASDIREGVNQQSFALHVETVAGVLERTVTLPLVGRYNVHNALAALAAAHAVGVPLDLLVERLNSFPGVPGRLQVVQAEPFAAVVDFAHTPTALQKVLTTLRPLTQGRLIVVVGAAGERDPAKRQPLGQVATHYADLAVFTEEDSRSEATEAILGELAAGASAAGGVEGETFWCLADRREAVHKAVSLVKAGDTLVFAGKGHERTLERAFETLPWDEVAEVSRALGDARG